MNDLRKGIVGILGGLPLLVGFFVVLGLAALALDEYILNTSLTRAARKGDTDHVMRLLKKGEDVNKRGGVNGHSALYRACSNGHTEMVKLLLSARADLNAPGEMDARITPSWQPAVKGISKRQDSFWNTEMSLM
jgi:ankyrin repeat protein